VSRRTPPERRADAGDPAGDPRAVRAAAVAQLARRDLPTAELRKRLAEKGFDPALVAAALAQLTAEHALDDARYAQNYVAYHAARGQGPVRIAADLRALGLPAELIDDALDTGPDWRALARQARVRKFGPDEPGSWAEKGRQGRFLQYRGFSSDHIRSALGPDFTPEE
jgi:regulatory protein